MKRPLVTTTRVLGVEGTRIVGAAFREKGDASLLALLCSNGHLILRRQHASDPDRDARSGSGLPKALTRNVRWTHTAPIIDLDVDPDLEVVVCIANDGMIFLVAAEPGRRGGTPLPPRRGAWAAGGDGRPGSGGARGLPSLYDIALQRLQGIGAIQDRNGMIRLGRVGSRGELCCCRWWQRGRLDLDYVLVGTTRGTIICFNLRTRRVERIVHCVARANGGHAGMGPGLDGSRVGGGGGGGDGEVGGADAAWTAQQQQQQLTGPPVVSLRIVADESPQRRWTYVLAQSSSGGTFMYPLEEGTEGLGDGAPIIQQPSSSSSSSSRPPSRAPSPVLPSTRAPPIGSDAAAASSRSSTSTKGGILGGGILGWFGLDRLDRDRRQHKGEDGNGADSSGNDDSTGDSSGSRGAVQSNGQIGVSGEAGASAAEQSGAVPSATTNSGAPHGEAAQSGARGTDIVEGTRIDELFTVTEATDARGGGSDAECRTSQAHLGPHRLRRGVGAIGCVRWMEMRIEGGERGDDDNTRDDVNGDDPMAPAISSRTSMCSLEAFDPENVFMEAQVTKARRRAVYPLFEYRVVCPQLHAPLVDTPNAPTVMAVVGANAMRWNVLYNDHKFIYALATPNPHAQSTALAKSGAGEIDLCPQLVVFSSVSAAQASVQAKRRAYAKGKGGGRGGGRGGGSVIVAEQSSVLHTFVLPTRNNSKSGSGGGGDGVAGGLSVSGFSRAFPLLAAASSSDTDGASGDDDTQQTQRHGVMLCTSDSVYVSRAGARGMQ